jgi:hypothetical protein
MVLVGLGAAAVANRRWGVQWRWLGCGALLWSIAMPAKRAIDALLSDSVAAPIGGRLSQAFHVPDVLLASGYVGLLTAVTLVAYTLAAGLLWRQLADDARRAIGIGIGIGAFEAIYYGMKVAVGLEPDWVPRATATAVLVPPVERILTIACHVLVATMVLYAVATRRWSWFCAGFAFFVALDGLAGFYIITGASDRINPWLLELSFAAFAAVAIPLLRYLWLRWPTPASPGGATLRRAGQG